NWNDLIATLKSKNMAVHEVAKHGLVPFHLESVSESWDWYVNLLASPKSRPGELLADTVRSQPLGSMRPSNSSTIPSASKTPCQKRLGNFATICQRFLKQFIPQSLSAAEKPVRSNIGHGSNG